MGHLGLALDRSELAEAGGFHFRSGHIDGYPVILAEAGCGKVATAIAASLLLDRFACGGVVFSGVAGGLDPSLEIGDIVIAEELLQHDYGAVTSGRLIPYHPGTPPIGEPDRPAAFRLDPALRQAIANAVAGIRLPPLRVQGAERRGRVLLGRVLSGDQFVNCAATRSRLHSEFGGQAVEMEGAALAQVAERFTVPFVVVRCLSDLAGAESHLDFAEFLPVAAEAAATVVRRLIPLMYANR